jgi:hypothetical protein
LTTNSKAGELNLPCSSLASPNYDLEHKIELVMEGTIIGIIVVQSVHGKKNGTELWPPEITGKTDVFILMDKVKSYCNKYPQHEIAAAVFNAIDPW